MSVGTDLHAVLRTARPAVEALVPPGIALAYEPALVDAAVAVPAAALQEALLALVHNAVAAMPAGGRLTIRTEHMESAGAELGPVPPLIPGRYMRLTVQDTGRGMDEPTRRQAIEVREEDTRGLARVLALVQQIRGALWLDSATTLGTRAFLYLPKSGAAADASADGDAGRVTTVLLVEDESGVRIVVRRVLVGQGFAVREARDGESALRVFEAERGQFVAVLTDVVMPVMGGRDLARDIRSRAPSLPLLFMSAYAGDATDLLDGVDEPFALLEKPFTNEALLSALGDLLGRGPA